MALYEAMFTQYSICAAQVRDYRLVQVCRKLSLVWFKIINCACQKMSMYTLVPSAVVTFLW